MQEEASPYLAGDDRERHSTPKLALREAAQVMGSARSARKAQAVRENGKLGGRPPRPVELFPCTCGARDLDAHKSRCPRGMAVKRRRTASESLSKLASPRDEAACPG